MKTKILALLCAVLMCSSCKDYLDIVPDNVATLDHAFTNMETAERLLFPDLKVGLSKTICTISS